jgi:hypothetical protein
VSSNDNCSSILGSLEIWRAKLGLRGGMSAWALRALASRRPL